MTELTGEHIDSLLSRLDLAQKVRLISGAGLWSTQAEPEIGLRRMVLSDGPAGVRGESWDERDPSVSLPSPTALAATWDEEIVRQVAGVLAGEAARKGVDVVLGPTVNLHRSPLGGRHFECLSEDPLLTSRIATHYVRTLQEHGIGATPKHYVANDSETDRFTVDARIDERTLRELYLAPFEALVQAGAWLVMSSYNQVNGLTMTESPLLREPLKTEWDFDGVVVSDWFAVRSTEGAAAANDLAMPGPSSVWGEPLVAAVREGTVPESAVDEKLRRLLRLAARVGALGDPEPKVRSAADPVAVARKTAAAGSVLVRNENSLLPLAKNALRKIAVIGPNAADARTQGGGSAEVMPARTVSPLEGLRSAAEPDVEITHVPGMRFENELTAIPTARTVNPTNGEPGVLVRFYDADDALLRTEHRQATRLVWIGWSELGSTSRIEVSTRFHAEQTGMHRLGVAGVGKYNFTAGETTLIDEFITLDGGDPVEALLAPPQRSGKIELDAGDEVDLVATHYLDKHMPGVIMRLDVEEPGLSGDEELDRAVAAAAEADVAVVVVGTTPQIESEGFDRQTLALPGAQDRLVHAVAAANPATVVVVNSGAPVELPWRADVSAILLSWFPGQEGGHALADVLFGDREPGGRLPTTWAAEESSVPVLKTRPTDGRLEYSEGLHIGYRAWARTEAEPAYAFGHGLGYTSWEYQEISEIEQGQDVTVRVRLTNTGQRRGREIVQIYLARPESSIERPAIWLAGFTPVTTDAGETVDVTVELASRSFQHWSVSEQDWLTEPGRFTILAGRSSQELPLRSTITVS